MSDEPNQQPSDEQPQDGQRDDAPAEEQSGPAESDPAPSEEQPREQESQPEGSASPEADEGKADEGKTDKSEVDKGKADEGKADKGKADKGKVELPPGAELDPIAISEDERELSAEERARLEAEAEERARREAEATAERRDEPEPAAIKPADLAKDARYTATGKRKSSIARVILRPGGGAIEINKRSLEEYFPRSFLQTVAKQALVHSGYEGTVDVQVRVHGGGISGQASAVRHGIARALTEIDPALRGELKKRGMLTRDARAKERRKAGLKKARKKPQFSKR